MVCRNNINNSRRDSSPPPPTATYTNQATISDTQSSLSVSHFENHRRSFPDQAIISNTSNTTAQSSNPPSPPFIYQTTNTSHDNGTVAPLPNKETSSQSNTLSCLSTESLATIPESPSLDRTSHPRETRSLVVRHEPTRRRSSHSTSLVYTRPSPYPLASASRRSQSLPRPGALTTTSTVEMSSASSSSGNTSTAGSNSGNNPTYQLPYAPFPYPMPPQGSNSQGGGSGK